MAVWSCLRSNVSKLLNIGVKNAPKPIRFMSGDHGHRTMPIRASNFQWNKLKDLVHLYALIGLIPIGILVFYVNVFIGPATLREIPEDYVPKHWEYYRHPITRFYARYVYPSPQQEYEKYCHLLYEEDEKMKIRKLQRQVRNLMNERNDYQAFYYIPVDGQYHRINRKASEDLAEIGGYKPPVYGPSED